MKFAEPHYAIYGIWSLIILTLFLIWAYRKRKQILSRFVEIRLLKEIADVNYKMRIIKSGMLILVFIFSFIGLMRPQWGFKWQEIKRIGLDILIAIDTSKSMLAQDVKPNRLERAKMAIVDMVKKIKGDRIGLIAFSGTAFLQCPLTADYGGFLLALNDIDVGIIPRGGTSVSNAIRVAIKSFEGGMKKYKILIIISDGEDHEGNPAGLARRAKKDGIKIYCIGIGNPEGELIQMVDKTGRRYFLKDKDGNIVKSRLNEPLLQKIALITGGSYIRSSGAEFGLDYLYQEKLSKLEKREIKSKMSKLYYERFQIPIFVAFVFLIVELFVSDRRKEIV